MDQTAAGLGVTDPYDVDQNLMGGALYLAHQLKAFGGDYRRALAAYNTGAANVQAGTVPAETLDYVNRILGGQQGGQRDGYSAERRELRPSQFGDPQLTAQEAMSACGPAAAVAFAHMYGRNPTLREATDMAKSVGWTEAAGMPGVQGQKALLDKMSIPSVLDEQPTWQEITRRAALGQPVTVSTADHYFVVDGYDPTTQSYHVGTSGTDTRLKKEWMSADEINGFGGVNGALYVDHPEARPDAAKGSGLATQNGQPYAWDGKVPAYSATYRTRRFGTSVRVGPDGQPQVDVRELGPDGVDPVDKAKAAFDGFKDVADRASRQIADDQPEPSSVPLARTPGVGLVDPWAQLYDESIKTGGFTAPTYGRK